MTEEEIKKKEKELEDKEKALKKKEEDLNNKETETLKAVNEEWQKKFDEEKKAHEEDVKKEQEHSVQQIRVLMATGNKNLIETKKETTELNFEEQLLKDTRKNLGLKEEN